MTNVTGTVTAPAIVKSHTNLPETATTSLASGATANITIGHTTNTGNVPQDVTFEAINVVGCTVNGITVLDYATGQPLVGAVAPNQQVTVKVSVTAPVLPAGAPNGTLSFNVVATWV